MGQQPFRFPSKTDRPWVSVISQRPAPLRGPHCRLFHRDEDPANLKNPVLGHAPHAVPSAGTSHRRTKKCRPQSMHRKGRRSQWRAVSREFRSPTPLKSTDRQCGHRANSIPYCTSTRSAPSGILERQSTRGEAIRTTTSVRSSCACPLSRNL